MKKIILIDYGSGNIHSAFKALQKASGNNAEVKVSNDPKDLNSATHIVLPGVGAFGDCYKGVIEILGMLDTIKENILVKKKPFLGICVGMQLLADTGYENGTHKGFGFIKGEVKKFPSLILPPQAGEAGGGQSSLKIPHMGWNDVEFKQDESLFKNIEKRSFYFVHSYYFDTSNENISATCNYGIKFAASVRKDNILGVQFHPEKSQESGLKLLANFISL